MHSRAPEPGGRRPPSRLTVSVATLAVAVFGVFAFAAGGSLLASEAASTTASDPGPAPAVKAVGWVLMDRRSGRVLESGNQHLRLAPASCTKIMTALLVLERYRDLTRMVRAPAAVSGLQGVAVGLRRGDRISLRQALRALMVKSANDAAVTLACAVSGSEARFVKLMNRRAAALGLTRTRFRNCRGAPVDGHYSSARDLAMLGRFAMRDARFRDLVGTKTRTITWPPGHAVTVTSHNRLLDYPWGDGIKTGSTEESRCVLVGSGKPGLVPLIVVTMREPTRRQEEVDAVALLRWGSSLYETRRLVAAGEVVTRLLAGDGSPVDAVAAAGLTAVIRKAAAPTLVYDLLPLPARPADGAVLGTVTYRSDGLTLGTVRLLAAPASSPSPSSVP